MKDYKIDMEVIPLVEIIHSAVADAESRGRAAGRKEGIKECIGALRGIDAETYFCKAGNYDLRVASNWLEDHFSQRLSEQGGGKK